MRTLLNVMAMGSFLMISPLAADNSTSEPTSPLGEHTIYYAGPFPKLNVVPTRESVEYGGIQFMHIDRLVRFMLASYYDDVRYQEVKTIVLDYGIEAANKPSPTLPKDGKGVIDSNWFIPMPARYFVKLSFYKVEPKDIKNNEFLKLTVLLPSQMGIGPNEAFHLMIQEGFQAMEDHPEKSNILLELD